MESKNLGYSLKNIPIPSKASYLKSMIDKVENFIKKILWKVHFFDNLIMHKLWFEKQYITYTEPSFNIF